MFQTPVEVTQNQLRQLRVSMVEALKESVTLFPLFDDTGECRFILVDTAGRPGKDRSIPGPDNLFVVDEFPMEIRIGKAIFAKPMAAIQSMNTFDVEPLLDLWHMDPWGRLVQHPGLTGEMTSYFQKKNIALLQLDGERIEDVCFSLDLRRVTGAMTRKSFFNRKRLELRALQWFLHNAIVPASKELENQQ